MAKKTETHNAKGKPSAIRDFPFGCGRNCPVLSKEIIAEYNRVHSAIKTNSNIDKEEELEEEFEEETTSSQSVPN